MASFRRGKSYQGKMGQKISRSLRLLARFVFADNQKCYHCHMGAYRHAQGGGKCPWKRQKLVTILWFIWTYRCKNGVTKREHTAPILSRELYQEENIKRVKKLSLSYIMLAGSSSSLLIRNLLKARGSETTGMSQFLDWDTYQGKWQKGPKFLARYFRWIGSIASSQKSYHWRSQRARGLPQFSGLKIISRTKGGEEILLLAHAR